ncbi:TcpQ domain-containing protein [Pantoea agglomerans]|uniref:TcpQ domain-containing protein n=1 Tax=Enterobacter agglomerans TaxID=549 RepID=UPI00320B8AA1
MSFTERAGLFPVLLLTGCTSPAVITGPPSGSVVDSMLSRSAADISAMQYRIHQSGPTAQRPGPPKATAPAVPLLSQKSVSTSRALSLRAPKASAALTGAGPVDGFVRQGGTAPTLRAALRKIIPPGQTVVFDKAVFADTPELWQWTGNDRWPFVADKLLAARGLKATINTKSNTVTIEPAQRAQTARTPSQTVPPPVPESKPNQAVAAGKVKAMPLPSTGRNPFLGSSIANTSVPALATGVTSPAQRVPVVPVMAPPALQVRHWRIESGNTVKDWLYSQAANEVCAVPGIKNWTVVWLTATNYRVDAPLSFDGNFREMLNQLFTLYGTAKVPLYAGIRTPQCVVKVDDKEVQ